MKSLKRLAVGCTVASSNWFHVASGSRSKNIDISLLGNLQRPVQHRQHRSLDENGNAIERRGIVASETEVSVTNNERDGQTNTSRASVLSPSLSPSLTKTTAPTFRTVHTPSKSRSVSPATPPWTNNTDDQDAYYYDVPLSDATLDNDDEGQSYISKGPSPSSSPTNPSVDLYYYDVHLSTKTLDNDDEGPSYISKSAPPSSSPTTKSEGDISNALDTARSATENEASKGPKSILIAAIVVSSLLVISMLTLWEMKRKPEGLYTLIVLNVAGATWNIICFPSKLLYGDRAESQRANATDGIDDVL